jgi:hypothetical protein
MIKKIRIYFCEVAGRQYRPGFLATPYSRATLQLFDLFFGPISRLSHNEKMVFVLAHERERDQGANNWLRAALGLPALYNYVHISHPKQRSEMN